MLSVRRPDRAKLRSIIAEEAAAADLTFEQVSGRSNRADIVIARARAVRRAITETGCSYKGLSQAWGIAERTVQYAMRRTDAEAA